MDTLKIKNKVLSDLLINNHSKDVNILVDHICMANSLSDEQKNLVNDKLMRYFIPSFERKWKNAFYNLRQFNKLNEKWLSSDFVVKHDCAKVGRKPTEDFESSSKSTKRRKTLSLINSYSPIEIENAFLNNLCSTGRKKLAEKIKNLILESTEDTEEITNEQIIPFTLEEAVALAEDTKLTKHQYETIRIQAKAKNADIFPLYLNLEKVKKECLPPEESMKITESGFRVELQDLCDHTVRRTLAIPNILPLDLVKQKNVAIKCFYKYGCDGASDQSRYNQKFSEAGKSDAGIFMMSMVPLCMKTICFQANCMNCPECAEPFIIWKNENPGSSRLCRLLMFEQAPETKERTISEIELMKAKIKNIAPTKIKVPDTRCTITVIHEFALTMVDGKVCQALSETPSAATCYICDAKPSQMNNLQNLASRPERKENFQFGLSTLHAWIRMMECILHISYRLGFCNWQAKTKSQKEQMQNSKQRIQKDFFDKMGLVIDVPKHGSGTSNTGNTARRFFRDPELTSAITGVNKQLIHNFGVILQAMASGEAIDTVKFKEYSLKTAQLYITLYDWYYMPVTVHKILLHGSKIIESAFLPIGQLTEEAQEATNKIFKHFREFNTRKCSREATNKDLGRKLLISTDPKIVHLRQKWKKKVILLDPEAKALLKE